MNFSHVFKFFFFAKSSSRKFCVPERKENANETKHCRLVWLTFGCRLNIRQNNHTCSRLCLLCFCASVLLCLRVIVSVSPCACGVFVNRTRCEETSNKIVLAIPRCSCRRRLTRCSEKLCVAEACKHPLVPRHAMASCCQLRHSAVPIFLPPEKECGTVDFPRSQLWHRCAA